MEMEMFEVSKFLRSMSNSEFNFYYDAFPGVIREVLGLANPERTGDDNICTFLFSAFSRNAAKYTNRDGLLMKTAVPKVVNDLPNAFEPWGITVKHNPESVFDEVCNKYKKIMKQRGVADKLADKAADDLLVVIVRQIIGKWGGKLTKVNLRSSGR
jgi:hypothetical protein